MQLKKMSFTEIMRGLGYSNALILFGHIMPNLREVVVAKYITSVASCILLESTLGFLGLGNVTDITWGGMINLAYKHGGFAMGAYNWFIAPGVCIMLLVLAFYMINYTQYSRPARRERSNGCPTEKGAALCRTQN